MEHVSLTKGYINRQDEFEQVHDTIVAVKIYDCLNTISTDRLRVCVCRCYILHSYWINFFAKIFNIAIHLLKLHIIISAHVISVRRDHRERNIKKVLNWISHSCAGRPGQVCDVTDTGMDTACVGLPHCATTWHSPLNQLLLLTRTCLLRLFCK